MSNFKDYVTSTAFNLKLTSKQIEIIHLVHHFGSNLNQMRMMACGGNVKVIDTLEHKGLIVSNYYYSTNYLYTTKDSEEQIERIRDKKENQWMYKISKEGELVFDLQEYAGLVKKVIRKSERINV